MASNFAKKLDRWCDNQWIVFLCVTATVVAVLAAVFWDVMPLGSKAGVFVAFIMAFHVLEEWKFPGGLHWFYNTSVFRPKDESLYDPTRYPMSRLTDMVTNLRSALLLRTSVERGCAVRHPAVRHGAVRPYGGRRRHLPLVS